MTGKKFVFAHILIPHQPFIFGPNGEEISNISSTSKVKGYREQVIYTNKLVRRLVTTILENSKRPPVIILQGDHGPRFNYVEPDSMDESLLIFNAYYLPGSGDELVPPNITPVNSFRIVFNKYFGSGLPILPDISYFNSIPYHYENGTFVGIPDTSTGESYYFAGGWEEPNIGRNDDALLVKVRWIKGNGTLFIPSGIERNTTLSFVAMSYSVPRTLEITVNGAQIGVLTVGTTATPGSFPVFLHEGDNTVVFSPLEGCADIWGGNVSKRNEWCFTIGIGDVQIR
jgi:hypothetical protein